MLLTPSMALSSPEKVSLVLAPSLLRPTKAASTSSSSSRDLRGGGGGGRGQRMEEREHSSRNSYILISALKSPQQEV
jgi:hypothetical protein